MSNTKGTHDIAGRLRAVRVQSDKSQREFATLLGLNLRTYQSYERGERELPKVVLSRLAEVSTVNPYFILEGREPTFFSDVSDGASIARVIPLIKHIKGGARHEYIPIDELESSIGHLDQDPDVSSGRFGLLFNIYYLSRQMRVTPDDARLLVVRGDSLAPLAKDGDLAIVDIGETNVDSEGYYAVKIGGAITSYHVQHLPGHRLRLSTDRPGYEPIVVDQADLPPGLTFLGRIVWVSCTL